MTGLLRRSAAGPNKILFAQPHLESIRKGLGREGLGSRENGSRSPVEDAGAATGGSEVEACLMGEGGAAEVRRSNKTYNISQSLSTRVKILVGGIEENICCRAAYVCCVYVLFDFPCDFVTPTWRLQVHHEDYRRDVFFPWTYPNYSTH